MTTFSRVRRRVRVAAGRPRLSRLYRAVRDRGVDVALAFRCRRRRSCPRPRLLRTARQAVVIEAGFADRDDARMLRQRAQRREKSSGASSADSRMNADCRQDHWDISAARLDRPAAALDGGADRDDPRHARGFAARASTSVEIVGEIGKIEMRVGVDQHCRVIARTSLGLPLDDRTRPGQSAAEDDEQDVIADLHPAGAVRFVERDGHGGGAGVAEAIEVHHEALERHVQPVGDGFDDAQVGLVRDDAGEIARFEIGVGERRVRGVAASR